MSSDELYIVRAKATQGKCLPGRSDVGPFLEMGLLNLASFAT